MLSAIYNRSKLQNRIFKILFFSFLLLSCAAFPQSASAAYTGEYWNITPATGPAFPGRVPDYTRSDPDIMFSWGEGIPAPGINANGFVARWTQTLNLAGGDYYFWVNVDDGVRVYLDNSVIINSWIDQAPHAYSAFPNITAGEHEIKVEYYENSGGATIEFAYENWSPAAQTYSPADNASGVGLNDNLVLIFDKDVYVPSGSANDIVIYDADDQVVESMNSTDAGRVNIAAHTITINPTGAFEELTDYYVKIKPDVFYSVAFDTGYHGISDKTTWNFRTGDFTEPDTGDDYSAKDGVWQNSNQTITLAPADPALSSGIAWTRYCTDDGTASCDPTTGETLSSPYQVTIESEGTTYLRYASRDNSGNTQSAVSREIKIDKTAPIVNAGNDQTTNTIFSRTAVVSDPLSGINVSTYRWTQVSGPGTIIFSDAGSLTTSIDADRSGIYTILFSVADNLGNSSSDNFILTDTGSVTLPPGAFAAPSPPVSGFDIKINNAAAVTTARNVSLGFTAGSDIKKMAISKTDDFSDSSLEDFQTEKSWDLCTGDIGGADDSICADGEYAVYVKFYTAWGQSSRPVSASINLVSKSGTSTNVQTAVPADPASESVGGTESVSVQSSSASRFVFTRYLRSGISGEDVRQLQIFLNRIGFIVANSGAGSPGQETTFFGPATKQALIKFQKKYNLKPYPGNVGPATLKLLNSL